MLNITINNATKVFQFNTVLQNIKNISNTILLTCDESGLYAQGMDGSHICLFELKIGSEWFDNYDCDEPSSMGINCEMLYKIISCLKEGQHINMKHNQTTSKLEIDLLGNSYDKSFELKLIDVYTELMTLPEKEYAADIKFVSQDYAELINQLSIFGEKLKITCNDNIILNSENDFGKVDIIVNKDDIIEYMIEQDSEIESLFGLKYIQMITRFAKLNKEVCIHISNDFPIKFVYSLHDWKEENDEEVEDLKHYIAFYLAPMEDE